MPNWCNNSVEIVGPRDKIRALWQAAHGTETVKDRDTGEDKTVETFGLLDAMLPQPEELNITAGYVGADDSPEQMALVEAQKANLAKYGAKDWYDWRVANWGTKWDISKEGLEYEEDEDGNFDNGTGVPYARITGWFDSAWAPPVEAFATYGEANPDVRLTLDYHEPGMAFVGRFLCEEGLGDDDCIDYSGTNSETVRDVIGESMDDFWCISEDMAEWESDNEEESA